MEDDAAAAIQTVSISHLLQLSSPLSGAASLRSSSSPPPFPLKKLKTLTNPNPTSLPHSTRPLLLVGAVHLPSPQSPCKNHCFAFSDASSRVCCSLLDLHDLSFISNEIHVLAWNFIPSSHNNGGGILEIIRWILPPSETPPRPLPAHHFTAVGALRCASTIFAVPCRNPGGDSFGFLAEVITCNGNLKESKFVYFLQPSSKWRPVVGKLIGKWVSISGLKKKLISVGENEKYEMLVTTEVSAISLCRVPVGGVGIWKEMCGGDKVYNGVVTGVYMHGMAVELDEKVWLLVTDPRVAPPHSIRVGAIISVRNFHLVRPKFSWIQIHLIGTCARTNIDVKSFSLPDTRSYVCTDSGSMLGKFIESLTLSAKFWLLLLVSCFRRKFAKIFSDKEILGSKHKEGLVQAYASRYLDSHLFQSQCGIFKDFCKHGLCICENESNLTPLKLVTPISNLISKCEAIWLSTILKRHCGAEKVEKDVCRKHLTSSVTSCHCTIRRIISSEDLGFILMGSLKILSSSGRLQMVDATGSIDIVIPDLLPNVNGKNIYEVKDYKLVMEGSPMQMDCMGFHSLEALSCRNIFEKFPSKKKLDNLAVHVLFYLKHSVCLNVPSQFPLYTFGNDRFNSNGEISHLLLISHKFPATENFQDDPNISCNSSLYAEAIVLPYKLILQKDNDDKLLADVLFGKEHKESYIESFRNTEVCHKRRKSFEIPCRANFLCLKDDFEEDERNRLKIRCLFTFSSINDQKDPIPGYLCYTKNIAAGNITDKRRDQRVLLEFKSDSFFIYQSLQIGWYYCLKCSSSGQCHTVNSEINHVKILIESQSILWSVAFKFGEIVHHQDPSKDCFFGASSSRISEAYVGDTSLNKIFFQQSLGQIDGNSDVHIYLSPVQIEKGAFIRTLPELGEILSVASCVQIMRAKVARNLNTGDCQISDMPQGNLISLYGNIEHIQIENYSPISYVSSKNFECLDIDKRASGIVIHVNDDHQKVQIHGNMRKHAYPLGMGPGANATFHRVLITCNSTGFPRLVLTPVSFIVINFIKEIGRRHTKEFTSHLELNVPNQESSEIVPLGLISQLSQCIGSKLIRLTCRVVTVHTLVLELPKHVSLKSQTSNQLKLPAYNITLAGLLLDDGSCLSCCWANEVRAERLLRLHETRQRPFFYNRGSSKKAGIRGYQDTVGFHLEKMLKKHHRVTIKNNRVLPDISTLGFTFAVDSEEVFSYSEERLLRLIMVNACVGSAFNIIGNVMDSNAIQLLGAEYEELNVAVPTMTNLWITEVGYLNSLKEARTIFHELSN